MRRLLLLLLPLCFTPLAAAQNATYNGTDGVSFQYPTVWKKVPDVGNMMTPMLQQNSLAPVAIVQFSPAGNLYAKTNLIGLDFSYYTAPAASAAACTAMLPDSADDKKPDPRTINGVVFQHITTDDSGMCHEMSVEAYATYRKGSCYLFEEDFMNLCAGVVDGTRALTPSEIKALQKHLDTIMQSVKFTP